MSELLRGVSEKRQNEADQAVHRELQEAFSKRLSILVPWKEVNIWHPYDLNSELLRYFSREMIRNACRNLGLHVYWVSYNHIYISIPKPVNAKKMTKAQEMLHSFNMKLSKCSKEAKASARKECDELIAKLLNKKYSRITHFKRSSIIEVGYFKPFAPDYIGTRVFEKEIYEIMRPHGITKISYCWDDRFGLKVASWTLWVDDNRFSFM